MGKKFDAIYESVVSRYVIGGYLPGDIVKFRPNYKSCDCYKAMNSVMQKELDELVNSGLNIRVVQVGDKLSGASAGNQHKTADNAVITVAGDHGGGRSFGAITVSPMMIDVVSSNEFAPPVPDEFRRDDNYPIKPEVFKADPNHITRVTDKGNGKNTPTNIKLAGEGTKIKMDNHNLAMLYESSKDFSTLYEKVLIEEGLLRRFANRLVGGFSGAELKDVNKKHEFAKSVAYDVGRDLSKVFGGNSDQHVQNIYQFILKYLKNI